MDIDIVVKKETDFAKIFVYPLNLFSFLSSRITIFIYGDGVMPAEDC